jgi:hypothetical protein
MGLELFAFGIGKTNIGRHVAAAFFEGHASLFLVALLHDAGSRQQIRL